MRAMYAAESNPRAHPRTPLTLSLPRHRGYARGRTSGIQTQLRPSLLHRRVAIATTVAYLVVLSNIYARPFATRDVPLPSFTLYSRETTRREMTGRADAFQRRFFFFLIFFIFFFLCFYFGSFLVCSSSPPPPPPCDGQTRLGSRSGVATVGR